MPGCPDDVPFESADALVREVAAGVFPVVSGRRMRGRLANADRVPLELPAQRRLVSY
jgi:hypothetical protein